MDSDDFFSYCYILQFHKHAFPFFSSLNWQAGSAVHVHWKGAAEIILESCSQYMDLNGSVQPIDQDVVGIS